MNQNKKHNGNTCIMMVHGITIDLPSHISLDDFGVSFSCGFLYNFSFFPFISVLF